MTIMMLKLGADEVGLMMVTLFHSTVVCPHIRPAVKTGTERRR